MKFLYTSNEKIKDKLITNGFTLLQIQGIMYIFANNGILTFDEEDKKEIFYRNELFL